MNFYNCTVTKKWIEAEDTQIYQLKPTTDEDSFSFLPGQYVLLKNPDFERPDEEHPFSIASSPVNHDYIEFCIKTYGDWTNALSQVSEGTTLRVSEPIGTFTWNSSLQHAVFLLGGIGISPIMSMLRFIRDMKLSPESLIMLYGNRTPETVAYRKELDELQDNLSLKIVDIYSHLPDDHLWKGHRGFITKEVMDEEVNFTLNPTFFIIGPPIFIQKMDELLDSYNIPKEKRKKEDLSILPQPSTI